MKSILVFFFCFTTFGLGMSQVAHASQESKSESCQKFLKILDNMSSQFAYGWIDVPENYDSPDSPKIQVFYYYSTRLMEAPESNVLFLNGGPGRSSHRLSRAIIQRGENLEGVLPVFVDQRGTGCSSQLPDPDEISRFTLYLSSNIVRDLEIVRKNLIPTTRWNLFGQSYGGLIAFRYIQLFSDSLNTVHIHGYSVGSTNYAEFRLRKHGKILSQYLETNPDSESVLRDLYERMKNHCLETEWGYSVCGSEALSSFSYDIYRPDWKLMNFRINILPQDGEVEIISLFNYDFPDKFLMLDILSNRIEIYSPLQESLSAHYEEVFERLRQEGIDPRKWLIGEEAVRHFALLRNQDFQNADSMPIQSQPITPKEIFDKMSNQTNLVLYLYSSSEDVFSPPDIFEPLVEALIPFRETRFYYHQLQGGHKSFLDSPLVFQNIVTSLGHSD